MAENRRLVIWHLATHKKPCLMVVEGNCATKIASFNNEVSAELFKEVMSGFIEGIYDACMQTHNVERSEQCE